MARAAPWRIVFAALHRRESARPRNQRTRNQSNPATTRRTAITEIRTIGSIEVYLGGEESATLLMAKPVLAFIWLYLLVRALLNPRDRISRSELAAELTPGLRPDRQRKRLRNRLSDMRHGHVPSALAERIVTEADDSVRLATSTCSIDLIRLQGLAAKCSSKNGQLPSDLAEEVALTLDELQGEFLPGWDQLEQDVTGGRGTSGALVQELRRRTQHAQIDLCAALASSYLARLEPARAIPLLEHSLEVQPEREDLARLLRAAYLETGQLTKASNVKRSYALEA